MKKLGISIVTAGLFICGLLTTVQATWNWEGFRAHNNVVSIASPRSPEETKLDWATDVTSGYDTMTNAVVVDGYIYIASQTDNQLLKLDANGSIVTSATMSGAIGYNGYIAYGDGKIFVSQADTLYDSNWSVLGTTSTIQAFSSDTLTSLWVSEELGMPGSYETLQSPIIYHEGYIYCGTANPSMTTGSYIALSTMDEDPLQTNEIKSIAWQYQSAIATSYSWGGGYVIGDAIVFIGNNGELVACSLTSGAVLATFQTGEPVASSLSYDSEYIYCTTKTGKLLAIEYSKNTYFGQQKTLTITPNGGAMTVTPTIYDGKIYLGGTIDANDFYAPGMVAVVDQHNFNVLFQAEVESNVQSSMLVSTYYDETYAYFTQNSEVGGVSCIKVTDDKIVIEDIFIPTQELQNYCNTSLITDGKVLYHTNDSGNIMALSKQEVGDGTDSSGAKEPSLVLKEDDQSQVVKTGDTMAIWPPLMGVIMSIILLKKHTK